jgi:hypothetical protein
MNSISKDGEREAFEAWASGNGEFPKAVERAPMSDGYRLMVTETYWSAWMARAALSPKSSMGTEPSGLTPALAYEHCFKAYEMPPQGDQLYMFNLERLKALVLALAAPAVPSIGPEPVGSEVAEIMRLARECAHKRATPANWHALEAAVNRLAAPAVQAEPKWGCPDCHKGPEGCKVGHCAIEPTEPAAQSADAVDASAMQMLWDDQPIEEKEHYRSVIRRAAHPEAKEPK